MLFNLNILTEVCKKNTIKSNRLKFYELDRFHWSIFLSMQNVNSFASYIPLLPFYLQFILFYFTLSFLELSNSHMRSELSLISKNWIYLANFLINLMNLFILDVRDQKNSSIICEMAQLSEFYVEFFEIGECILQVLCNFIKMLWMHKRKNNINVGRPSFKCRVMFLPYCLNLLYVSFSYNC